MIAPGRHRHDVAGAGRHGEQRVTVVAPGHDRAVPAQRQVEPAKADASPGGHSHHVRRRRGDIGYHRIRRSGPPGHHAPITPQRETLAVTGCYSDDVGSRNGGRGLSAGRIPPADDGPVASQDQHVLAPSRQTGHVGGTRRNTGQPVTRTAPRHQAPVASEPEGGDIPRADGYQVGGGRRHGRDRVYRGAPGNHLPRRASRRSGVKHPQEAHQTNAP